ncbi:hypothetical protein, partial [Staphylococcus aureus]|uniref:hypothetical protein n=1 Tax=Staphylococcus aureus TaxID=1280 RepID=UPI00203D3CA9
DYGDYELLDAIRMNKARMRLEVQTPGKNALFIVDSWPQEIPQLGVTLLLFTIGLKLNVKILMRRDVWGTTSLHLLLSTLLFTVVLL